MPFSIVICDEPDSAALRDRYRQAHLVSSDGVYQDSNLHRWRFGRVMDLFK